MTIIMRTPYIYYITLCSSEITIYANLLGETVAKGIGSYDIGPIAEVQSLGLRTLN